MNVAPPRRIGLAGGIALVVGITIGSGIFRTPATISGLVPDARAVLALWTAFGLVSLCGALALAELATMLPRTGGVYVFLREAYGDGAAFVYGWLCLLVAGPAAVGALAVFVLELGSGFFPGLPEPSSLLGRAIAAGLVVLLSLANAAGLRWGAGLQHVFTALKVATILFVVGLAFASPQASVDRLSHASGGITAAAIAAALASVFWTYDGWVQVSLLAGEVAEPERRLTRIIVGGLGAVVVLYLAANFSYALFFAPAELAGEKVVAASVAARVLGPGAAAAVKLGILASVVGALCGNILARPRVTWALAQDGLAFAALGRLHPRTSTPHLAIFAQAVAAAVLIAFLRDFETLIAAFVVAESLGLVAAVAAVVVLRYRRPDLPRPFRVPGYPWVPAIFVIGMLAGLAAVVWGELSRGVWSPLIGLAVIVAGFAVYRLRRRRPAAIVETPA